MSEEELLGKATGYIDMVKGTRRFVGLLAFCYANELVGKFGWHFESVGSFGYVVSKKE